MTTATAPCPTLTPIQRAVVQTTVILEERARAGDIYPLVPSSAIRVYRELAEQAVRPDGGRYLSVKEIAAATGVAEETVGRRLQYIPGVLAIYAPGRVKVARLVDPDTLARHGRRTYLFRLELSN
jgi:hypothetical protein